MDESMLTGESGGGTLLGGVLTSRVFFLVQHPPPLNGRGVLAAASREVFGLAPGCPLAQLSKLGGGLRLQRGGAAPGLTSTPLADWPVAAMPHTALHCTAGTAH